MGKYTDKLQGTTTKTVARYPIDPDEVQVGDILIDDAGMPFTVYSIFAPKDDGGSWSFQNEAGTQRRNAPALFWEDLYVLR